MQAQNTNDSKQYKLMTETPIPSLITKMAIPTVISMVITAVYNIADTFFVSQLGTSASGAVGVVLPLMAIIQAVGFTVGMGGGSWVSRLLGEQKKDRADSIASSSLAAALILGAIITVAGLCAMKPLMRVLGATETILPYAIDYATYILIAGPIMSASFVLNNLLRSQGKAKLAMFGIATGGILNMFLDPLFIFGFKMGIAGAATATALSQLISFCILAYSFIAKKSITELSVKKISKNFMDYLIILKLGFPSLCRQGLASIATVLLNNAAVAYGDAAIASMSIVGKLFMILFSVVLGIGQGYQPVLGYNYGAKRHDRCRSAAMFTFVMSAVFMGILSVIMYIFAPQILTAFISDDPAVVDIGKVTLRAQCIVMPLTSLSVVANMSYQTTGKSLIATILSCARQGIFYIPSILLLPARIGLLGVQLTQSIADLCTLIFSLPFFIAFLYTLKKEETQYKSSLQGE